ncbi:uncharacterized protein EV154DRAFT_552769 [Mucor mucedo]|uniref:uncharacterized protein n=1 Tax=Mucor mucedo TaxID=29922 RepID=UPI00221E7C72|nr:uncharacterized protein EV154DRAFT_552769 [Mucor mucedo]KAI7889765.1 hypothetical protein EV154DRAFT_552769 [Mucor mucedo]
MPLTIDDVVTHYVLSSHPRNRAIIDIKNKKTGELRFIKIRHRLSKFYAVSLVDPVTFEVWAETQVKSASSRIKPIILHLDENNKNDTPVELRDSSRIGFEWSFIWEGEKYRWVRESRMSNSLECRAVRKTGDICVAQYLPRILKDEYFGIFSLLGYNMLRCDLTKSRELELIILMSLMTLLDKSDDGGWKRDPIGKGVQDDVGNYENANSNDSSNNNSTIVSPTVYEDPIPKKAQQKKHKVELSNDQKLHFMLEKDVRRSQKQIQFDQKKQKPMSAGNSPAHTPDVSPLPTPSASSTNVTIASPRLTRQKSACNLNYYKGANASNVGVDSPESPVSPVVPASSGTTKNGRLSKLFSSLSHKQTNSSPSSPSTNTSPVDAKHTSIHTSNDTINASQNTYADIKYQKPVLQRSLPHEQHYSEQQYENSYPYYDNQRSLPVGQYSRLTNEFGNLAINKNHYDNPPSVRTIRWNPEPLAPIQTSAPIVNSSGTNKYSSPQRSSRQPVYTSQQIHNRSNSQDRRRPRVLDEQRRMSASEYSFAYHPHQQHAQSSYNYMPPSTNKYPNNNRYSASEYYTYQQPPQQYDYYQ